MKSLTTAAGAACAAHCLTLYAAFAMGNGYEIGNGSDGSNGWGNGVGNPHNVPELGASVGVLAQAWKVNRRSRV